LRSLTRHRSLTRFFVTAESVIALNRMHQHIQFLPDEGHICICIVFLNTTMPCWPEWSRLTTLLS
jgi:hypothetical protein